MRILILIFTIFLCASCKKENAHLDKLSELNFTTEKIIMEDLPGRSENSIYHFLIGIENPTEEKINLSIIDLQNQSSQKNKTMFYLEMNGEIYSTISYLNGNEALLLDSKNKNYILLSLTDEINRNDLDNGFVKYLEKGKNKKTFPIVAANTEKIFTDHKIDIEEAIMLVHGKINGKQY